MDYRKSKLKILALRTQHDWQIHYVVICKELSAYKSSKLMRKVYLVHPTDRVVNRICCFRGEIRDLFIAIVWCVCDFQKLMLSDVYASFITVSSRFCTDK